MNIQIKKKKGWPKNIQKWPSDRLVLQFVLYKEAPLVN